MLGSSFAVFGSAPCSDLANYKITNKEKHLFLCQHKSSSYDAKLCKQINQQPSANVQKRHQQPMPESIQLGTHFDFILGAQIDQKSIKHRSQNGCKICMRSGIDFLSVLADVGAQDGAPGAQDGAPRGGNEGPTNRPFRSKLGPGPPTRPKTAQDPQRPPSR